MTSSKPSFPRIVIVGIVVGLIHSGIQILSVKAAASGLDGALLSWAVPRFLPFVPVALSVFLMNRLVGKNWPGCVTVAAVVFFFSLILVYGPFDEAIESIWAMALFLADALAMKLLYPLPEPGDSEDPASAPSHAADDGAEAAGVRREIFHHGLAAGCIYLACWIATLFVEIYYYRISASRLWYSLLLPTMAAFGVSLVFARGKWKNWFWCLCLAMAIWLVGILFFPWRVLAIFPVDLYCVKLLMWAAYTLFISLCLWSGSSVYQHWKDRAGRE